MVQNKYLTLLSISWQNGFVYKASVFLWRLRMFLSNFLVLSVWTVIFSNQNQAFGYQSHEIISYVFITAVLHSVILTTSLGGLSSTIYSGDLSNLLLKPIGIFKYLLTDDIADKLKNFIFGLIEILILFFIFQPELFLPNLINGFIFLIWVIAGIAINFLITLLLGAVGFWSPDSWGPRFLFFMFVDFAAGKLYPLDILPNIIQKIIYLTPLPYLTFAQTQLYLNKMTFNDIVFNSLALTFWIILLTLIVKKVWSNGLKEYASMGR